MSRERGEGRDPEDTVAVFTTTDSFLLPIVCSALEAAGIPHVVQGAAGTSLFPLGAAGGRVTGRLTGSTVLVPREYHDEAKSLIEETARPT